MGGVDVVFHDERCCDQSFGSACQFLGIVGRHNEGVKDDDAIKKKKSERGGGYGLMGADERGDKPCDTTYEAKASHPHPDIS